VPVLSAISVVFMYLYRKAWKDAPRPALRSPTPSHSKSSDSTPLATPPT